MWREREKENVDSSLTMMIIIDVFLSLSLSLSLTRHWSRYSGGTHHASSKTYSTSDDFSFLFDAIQQAQTKEI